MHYEIRKVGQGIIYLQFDYLCVVGECACVSVDALRNLMRAADPLELGLKL